MTSYPDEISHLRSGLNEIADWATKAAAVCRELVERNAWQAIADIANTALKTPRASIVKEIPIVKKIPRKLSWLERLSGWTSI